MIGVLFGAGASFGSEPDSSQRTPPLGRELFSHIKDKKVGPRLRVEVMQKLYGDSWEMLGIAPKEALTPDQSIESWLEFISKASLSEFNRGDFESGMRILADAIDEMRSKKRSKLFGGPINEFDGSTLPFRIMAEVASFLSKYKPSFNNFYYKVLDALPHGSHIATLNYDSLIEDVAVFRRINLREPPSVAIKTMFHGPTKEFDYYQLHGGVTLLSMWQRRFGLAPDLIMHCKAQRANVAMWAFSLENGRGEAVVRAPDDTYENVKERAVLSYYHPNKTTVICPDVIKGIQEAFKAALAESIKALIIIGCRYTPHDAHIWKPIEEYSGDIYWVGSNDRPQNQKITVIGSRFGDSVGSIIDAINRVT